MRAPRFFILTGAASAGDIRDRAAAHGDVLAVVAHSAPGPGCYGAAEIRPATSGCAPSNEDEKQERRSP